MPRPPSSALEFARQHAAKAGLHPKSILRRLRNGWTREHAIGEQERPKVKPGPKTGLSLMPDYASRYHAKRRKLAIAKGVCVQCNFDKAEEDATRCGGCLEVESQRYHNKKAA